METQENESSRLDELLAEAEAEEVQQVQPEEEAPEDYGAAQPAEDEAARAMVGMGWGFIESTIKGKYPEVEIAAGTDQKAVEALTPVALKYGLGAGEMPEWVARFMPEIRAAIFLGGFAFGIVSQVKRVKAEQEKKDKPRVRVQAGYNFEEVKAAYGN